MEIARQFLIISGYVLIVISLIPLIRKDNWFFRIFEYPRAQKLVINFVLLVSFIGVADYQSTHHIVFSALLLLNLAYLTYQVWPYTFLSKHQLCRAEHSEKEKKFSFLIFNVYQNNRNIEPWLKMIAREKPDVVLLVEVNGWCKAKLDEGLKETYPFQLGQPLENTYGMMLYSKFELSEGKVRYLIEKDIPSIDVNIKLPSGDLFKLYGLHPQPPVPQENPRSTERNAEILLIGEKAKAQDLPVIVAGDLNDVAWSYTTELFMKVSGLLDPRRGRGFYNTFHARHWFLRWPLDHIFCSTHFQLITMRRLEALGSDHFPILVSLVLKKEESGKAKKQKLSAKPAEKQVAQQKIKKGLQQRA